MPKKYQFAKLKNRKLTFFQLEELNDIIFFIIYSIKNVQFFKKLFLKNFKNHIQIKDP